MLLYHHRLKPLYCTSPPHLLLRRRRKVKACSVNIPSRWFDWHACKDSIEKYKLSISRNNQLKDHVLQLQGILLQYVDKPMPAARPYNCLPQFMASSSKAPGSSSRTPSIRRVSGSRRASCVLVWPIAPTDASRIEEFVHSHD